MANIYQIFGKALFKTVPVLPDKEDDLGHENIVNAYLFPRWVLDIACFGEQYANAEKL